MKHTLLFTLAVLSTITLSAQVLFQSSFDGLNTGTSLDGQNGWSHDTSSGGTGSNFGVASNPSQIVNFPISYTDYPSTTNSLESDNTIDSDGPGRLLATPITSGTYYLSFTLNVTVAPNAAAARDVIRMLNGGAFSTSSRVFIQRAGGGFNVGIKIGDPSSPSAIDPLVYTYNQNHLIVVKYEIVDGANNDSMTLYVDPILSNGEPATANALAPVSTFEVSNNIDRFAFPWNVSNSGRFAGHVGSVSVTRNWFDMTTLSTPSISKKETNLNFYSESKTLQLDNPQSGTLSIFSIDGKRILDRVMDDQNSIDLKSLHRGMYIARLTTENGNSSKLKFIVE
ncbi:MAG: T9SS type A sorting domain-containing protein [Nonlabens sp.]